VALHNVIDAYCLAIFNFAFVCLLCLVFVFFCDYFFVLFVFALCLEPTIASVSGWSFLQIKN
jgi:hypothetical protein